MSREDVEKALRWKGETWTPTVILVETLRRAADSCPSCGARAVVPLTEKQGADQKDGTTHVCHPTIGGCNHGFIKPGFPGVTR